MRSTSFYANIINRKTLQSYSVVPQFQTTNVKMNIFNFTDVFDLDMAVPLNNKPKITSQSFIEFFFEMPNGKKHQVATGYLEDFVSTTGEDQFTFQANGKGLIGQLMNSNFKQTLYAENMELASFVNLAAKGEYLESYNKFKGRPGMVIDCNYNRAAFLASSDQTQMKGQILERYGKLGCTLIFQDRLGRVVLLGKDFKKPAAKGRLTKAKGKSNIRKLQCRSTYSEVHSDATIFYTQAEALSDANTTPSVRYQNTDPRVIGVVNRPLYETFSVSDIQHFAGNIGADERMSQVARSRIRQSNRKVNQVTITTDVPYFFDSVNKDYIPFEMLQVWEIESDQDELTSAQYPEGTNVVEMVLTGIDYSGTADGTDVQLQFTEFETLV